MMLSCHTKMNSKDKAFLEKFCVKESSNLIGLENFGATGFSITAMLGWCSPHQPKSDQISTHQSPPMPHFYILSMKAFLQPIII